MTRPNSSTAKDTVEEAVRDALGKGRVFKAYDIAIKGLETGSNADRLHLLAATALVRSGAIDAAREQIRQAAIAGIDPEAMDPTGEEGTLLADVFEEIWQSDGQADDLGRALAIRLHRAQTNGDFQDLAQAALLAQAGGDRDKAGDFAQVALRKAADDPTDDPARPLVLAELFLLIGQDEEAAGQLENLAGQWANRPLLRAEARQRLEALSTRGVDVDQQLIDLFIPPCLLVYAGIRLRGGADGGLPPALEPALRQAIDKTLSSLNPAIAYGSAAAGCDLLFCENLLARGVELNVVLPFQRDSFRDQLVAPYGPAWLARFDRVVGQAASVTEVCQEPYVGGDAILRFGNQVIDGTARLRGAVLSSPPYLAAIWDFLADPFPGSPNDFVDNWGDPARLRLMGLDEIADEAKVTLGSADTEDTSIARSDGDGDLQKVAGLLFADVVGFSRLKDDQLILFWRFMRAIALHMGADVPTPRIIDSWGDAILTVHDTALESASYATALYSAFRAIDSRDFGLSERLQLRIGLHAGPIFEGDHPLTGQTVIYGGNVNRAARIEPITVPGLAYASEQFVAALTAEESALEAENQLAGGTYRPRFRCFYRGTVELPKGYGTQSVYEVKPWREASHVPAVIEPGRHLHATLANELYQHRRLAALFKQLVAPLDFPESLVGLFEMAFDEIVTNICSYAWHDRGQHAIEVDIDVSGDTVEATFTDDGVAFNPLEMAAAPVDGDIDERTAGGLGIHLLGEMMDEVRYRRDGDANHLTVVKRWRD